MRALDQKLLRDLVGLKAQVLTIALVVACGIASYVTLHSAYDSLIYSRDAYYEHNRFPDAFAHLERAPKPLAKRLALLPGVSSVETRIQEVALVPIKDLDRAATGILVSIPNEGSSQLSRLHLTRGRLPDEKRSDEIVVLDAFAEAHQLALGDSLEVILNSSLRKFRVVGVAMSPEFVMTMPPGGMSYDPKRAAVLWLRERVLASAFQLEGAFNDAQFNLEPGVDPKVALQGIDRVLQPYGGLGAVAREKQASNYMLSGELTQLESMATVVPAIFLFVAAFLLNVVLSRLITLQRSQIATLKAVGYDDRAIGLHYLELVSVVVVLGALGGVALGAWLGDAMTQMYTGQYFRFPEPEYRLEARVVVFSLAVSLVSAVIGAGSSVWAVARLPPAEAMRPPAPARYQFGFLNRIVGSRLISVGGRMVAREILRRPLRALLSAVGVAFSIGIVVVAGFWFDAIDNLLNVQFHESMREDLNVTLMKPVPERAVRELGHLPGVRYAEGYRNVSIRFSAGHHARDGVLIGMPRHSELRRVVDREGAKKAVPEQGVLLSKELAKRLDVRVGDEVRVELREGDRSTKRVAVAGLVDDAFGLQGYMNQASLSSLLGETPSVNLAALRIDAQRRSEVLKRLNDYPGVLAVAAPSDLREQFEAQSGEIMYVYTFIMALFASVIAIGVVYNGARVSLSQRSRDLASLRVLGFTRGEIAGVLFGELVVHMLLAIPLGIWFGGVLSKGLMAGVDPEIYRLPIVLSPRTYAFAVSVAIGSGLISALLVRRKLDKLDLIGVLKTRE
ncbi:MAG: FtsX-like permease family protein [Polyangiaceae bacterium]